MNNIINLYTEFFNERCICKNKSVLDKKSDRLIEYLHYLDMMGMDNFTPVSMFEFQKYALVEYDVPGKFKLVCGINSLVHTDIRLYIDFNALVEKPFTFHHNYDMVRYSLSHVKYNEPFMDKIKQKNINTVIRRLLAGDRYNCDKKAFE